VNPLRLRLSRADLALLSIALTFLGMFGWFSAREALRADAWVDTLVFGLVALAGFLGGLACSVLLARSSRARRLQHLQVAIAAEPAFVGTRFAARFSLVRACGLVLIALLLGGYAVLIVVAEIYAAHRSVFGLFLAPVVFWASACLGWMALRLRPVGRPTLRMDSDGLAHSLAGEVRWADVIGIALQARSFRGMEYHLLVLGLRNPGSVRQSVFARWMMPARGQFRFSLKGLDQPPARIHAAALALRDRVEPPRSKFWFPGINPIDLERLEQQDALFARLEADRTRMAIPAHADPAGTRAAIQEFEQLLTRQRDEVVAEAVRNYDARRERGRVRSLWTNRVAAVLLGLAAAWMVYSYFFVWQ
jgi:hypothetical protein